MKILLFGMLASEANQPSVEIEEVRDVRGLRRAIREKFPTLVPKTYMVAVNCVKADDDMILRADDEIALLPPFAGG